MRRILVTLLVALLALPLVATSAVSARQSTPGAMAAGECIAPEIPPGTPTPMEEMMPPEMEATPEDGVEASPATDEEMMMPPMPEPMTGEPASADQAAAAEDAVNNYWDCWKAGMWVEVGALYTAAGLMEDCGTANIYDTEMCLAGFPGPITLIAVDNAQVLDDGRIAIDVTYSAGNWLRGEQYVFVQEGDFLLLDTHPELVLEAPAGATTIDVELVDYAFELSATSAPAGDIAFNLTNSGAEPHEFVMVSMPEGMELMDAMEDESLFADITFYGAAFAMPGESSMLVFTNMEPGTYTVVCFFPTAEGVPHVVEGMIAEFEVTEP